MTIVFAALDELTQRCVNPVRRMMIWQPQVREGNAAFRRFKDAMKGLVSEVCIMSSVNCLSEEHFTHAYGTRPSADVHVKSKTHCRIKCLDMSVWAKFKRLLMLERRSKQRGLLSRMTTAWLRISYGWSTLTMDSTCQMTFLPGNSACSSQLVWRLQAMPSHGPCESPLTVIGQLWESHTMIWTSMIMDVYIFDLRQEYVRKLV